MLKKAKELFAIRKQTSEKTIPQNTLYSARQQESSSSNVRLLKLNVNLIFNKKEYKSVPDSPEELAKRRQELEALLAAPLIDMKRLRELAWKGVETHRSLVWRLLLGVLSNAAANHK